MATNELFDMISGDPASYGIVSNPQIEELLRKQKEDQTRMLTEQRARSDKYDLGKQVQLEDEPGNNAFNAALLGMLRRGVDEKSESPEEFLNRRTPALSFFGDIARGWSASKLGIEFVSTRERLMDEYKVEQRGKETEMQIRQQNQLAAIRLAADIEKQKRDDKIQAIRDETLQGFKKELENLKSDNRWGENQQKSDLRMNEFQAQGKIREDALQLRFDLTENLEKFKITHKEKAADVAFGRAKELVRLRSTLGAAAKESATNDIVDSIMDVASAGLISQDKILTELDAKTSSKVLKRLKDENILIFQDKGDQDKFNNVSTALSIMVQIHKDMLDPELGLFTAEGPNARIRGTIEQVQALMGNNPKLNALQAKVASLGPTMARIRGDRGNIAIVEQAKALEGFFSKPTATRSEGEALFNSGGVDLLNTALADLKSRLPQAPNTDPTNTYTTEDIFLRALERNQDPVMALRAAIQRGANVLPADYSSLLQKGQ